MSEAAPAYAPARQLQNLIRTHCLTGPAQRSRQTQQDEYSQYELLAPETVAAV